MSRAFVREADGSETEDLPDRPVSPHPNLVTIEGLAQIEAELAASKRRLEEAQSSDDRSETARALRDLRYWTQRRATAEVVHAPAGSSQVRFGSRVTFERDDGRRQTYRIVGEDEADPARGSISYVSPLAQALMGKAVGDVVAVAQGEAEIIAIA